jgi:hypothetical protein
LRSARAEAIMAGVTEPIRDPATDEAFRRGPLGLAGGVAIFVVLAPALFGVVSSAGDGVPAITALIATVVGAGAMALIGAVTLGLGMSAGYRPWATVGVLIAALVLWWLLAVVSPTLGVIYQNISEPAPGSCSTGEACL